jgi:hypothetical protein
MSRLWAQQDHVGGSTDTSFRFLYSFGSGVLDFSIDNLGNVYIIDKDNLLKKYDSKGDSLAVFNNFKRYGKLYSIDVTNPLKPLLFYKDFGTVVVLDRFLSVRDIIDIRNKGIFQPAAVAQAFDNGIWIYDSQEARLKRMNEAGTLIFSSVDFRQAMESAPVPLMIADQNRLVYLYDPERGMYVFDYFGTLKNKVSILGWQDFQVIGADVYGRKENKFLRYELNSLSITEQPLTRELAAAGKIRVASRVLYALINGRIAVYKW